MGSDSFISFDEGTERKWAFWQRSVSSNTVEELKVVLSEPFIPTYTVTTTAAISTGTADSHLIQIMGSTLNRVMLRRIEVTQMVAAGAATQAQFQLVRLTTAGTGGTTLFPRPVDPADGATTASAMSLPSSKGTESGVVLWNGSGSLLATVPVAGRGPVIDWDWRGERTKGPTIAAGVANGLALKLITAVATGTVFVTAEFAEAFWS